MDLTAIPRIGMSMASLPNFASPIWVRLLVVISELCTAPVYGNNGILWMGHAHLLLGLLDLSQRSLDFLAGKGRLKPVYLDMLLIWKCSLFEITTRSTNGMTLFFKY